MRLGRAIHGDGLDGLGGIGLGNGNGSGVRSPESSEVAGLRPTRGPSTSVGMTIARRAALMVEVQFACGGLGDGGQPGGWLFGHCPGHASNPSAHLLQVMGLR